mmetsp:Transcript_117913/g.368754  ORF Transcript_117913/g.368754 Transcript_117913/m.368754 type:complete len:207 (-) Transcript_117913:8-628(-)
MQLRRVHRPAHAGHAHDDAAEAASVQLPQGPHPARREQRQDFLVQAPRLEKPSARCARHFGPRALQVGPRRQLRAPEVAHLGPDSRREVRVRGREGQGQLQLPGLQAELQAEVPQGWDPPVAVVPGVWICKVRDGDDGKRELGSIADWLGGDEQPKLPELHAHRPHRRQPGQLLDTVRAVVQHADPQGAAEVVRPAAVPTPRLQLL